MIFDPKKKGLCWACRSTVKTLIPTPIRFAIFVHFFYFDSNIKRFGILSTITALYYIAFLI
jgi:hypothetical protein